MGSWLFFSSTFVHLFSIITTMQWLLLEKGLKSESIYDPGRMRKATERHGGGRQWGESLSIRYMVIFVFLNLNILKNTKQEWHLEFRCMLIFFAALFFLLLLGIQELRCSVQVTADLGNRRVSCGDGGTKKAGKKNKTLRLLSTFHIRGGKQKWTSPTGF